MEFHHVQLYVDYLKDLSTYKRMEDLLNTFSGIPNVKGFTEDENLLDQARSAWKALGSGVDEFSSVGQDIVEQMIFGLGWRVTASAHCGGTQSVLVASPDASGAQFIVSALDGSVKRSVSELSYLNADRVTGFFNMNRQRQGIAVLGFKVSPVVFNEIEQRYASKHEKLMVPWGANQQYDSTRIMEVFAYYSKDGNADEGTVIRFVDTQSSLLPGFNEEHAVFSDGLAAYSDHWVSNVFNRQQFLSTLEDTLGFTPKVDFNAGVVSAGQAIIESTVTGNSPAVIAQSKAEVLRDQSQIFLPINNAMSSVGHVHLFLEEIGQGVQHIASRVKDLVGFIKRVNHYRMVTGKGLSFLRIPRSYYGRLDASDIGNKEVFQLLIQRGIVSSTGIVELDVSDEKLEFLKETCGDQWRHMVDTVKLHRYNNLYKLLGDNLDERTYVDIVRNKILVDIQGDDILYQIFTSNILQRQPSDESPFLEFIQRVCSQKKDKFGNPKPVKPGCGGFGIRNFLTLFLSIEVSKAMSEFDEAVINDNEKLRLVAEKKIELFTAQLEESNPVLTMISDAMTEEGDLIDLDQNEQVETALSIARLKKFEGQKMLQNISEKYSKKFAALH